MEWHEDLENVCQQAGLKGKKLSKVFYISIMGHPDNIVELLPYGNHYQ